MQCGISLFSIFFDPTKVSSLGQVLVSPKTVLGSEDMNNMEGLRQVERMVLE
jgi:hypothetical protein